MGLFGLTPCITCNGSGWLDKDGKPPREWDVIAQLLSELEAAKKKTALLQKALTDRAETAEQHSGLYRGNRRGD